MVVEIVGLQTLASILLHSKNIINNLKSDRNLFGLSAITIKK